MLPGNERDQQANSRSFLFGLVMLVVFLSLQSVRTRDHPSSMLDGSTACRWLVVALLSREIGPWGLSTVLWSGGTVPSCRVWVVPN
jgi:hypothetical protein